MQHWLIRLFMVMVCWSALPTHAEVLDVQRAYWIDMTGKADIEQAAKKDYLPAPKVLAQGYGTATTWLRVTVPPHPLPELIVTVTPTQLDDVRLFTRAKPNESDPTVTSWHMRQQGDHIAFNQRERPSLNFSFAIAPSATAPTLFFVRVETTSTRAMYVSVQTPAAAELKEDSITLGVGVYLGLVVMLAFFSLIRAVVTREQLWALNTVMQFVMVVWVLVYLGFPAKYVWQDGLRFPDHLLSATYCIYIFTLYVYYRQFAIAFSAPRWLVVLLSLTMLALPWQLWAIFWHDQVREASQLNASLTLFRVFAGLFLVWFFVVEDRLLRWMVRITHISQSLYGIVLTLPQLGIGEMNEWHLYPAFFLNLSGAAMQYMVLTRRDVLQRREQAQLRQRMLETEQQLGWERERLKESASFMAMLLHELKNPLASIRLATQSLRTESNKSPHEQSLRLDNINQSIDGINAVMERCRQVDKLEQGNWPAEKVELDVVALTKDCISALAHNTRIQANMPEHLSATQEATLLRTMVTNLLDNALAYSALESVVSLRLHETNTPSGRHFVLTVRNTVGKPGLPDPERVFTKYYRAEKSHQRTGSGLGLFLVQSLAQSIQGQAQYRVELDATTGAQLIVFELNIPCQ